jgi:hypothetical protein
MIRMTGLVDLKAINNSPVNSKTSLKENLPLSNREVSIDDKFDDHEAPMAKAQLMNIHKQSAELFNMIGDNEELEGWVQHKLSLAADYINAVHSNMQYEKSNISSIGNGMGLSAIDPMGTLDGR